MSHKLSDDDRSWRDQFVPNVSDDDLKKMIEVLGGNGKGKEKKEKPIPIKKYSASGTIPLHESVVVGGISKFVYLDKNGKPVFVDKIERVNDDLIPADTIDTQNPIPFIFESENDFDKYLEQAKKLDLETIFDLVESINRKYVDIEDHYHVLLTADMIWTWLQDKFGITHYNIITGDNGSGKNSQLLVFRFLGYRVFYVVSASAPNYFTKMGNIEEGQITVAEDEVGDIAIDKDKRNIFTSGYASGGSVPKVELEGGRKSEDWLTYGQKWITMEELLTQHKDMKAVLDRAFTFRFVSGDPQYNIKDVIKSAGDPKFKPLHDELIKTRKLLFCWRLIHYDDIILDVELNVKNRNEELTKPLIRLFQHSPIALERILNSLTKFLIEKSEIKKGSFESKLYDVIDELKKEEKALPDETDIAFTNLAPMEKTKEIMDCKETEKNGLFWSEEVGTMVSQGKITSISKSKFKAKPFFKRLDDPDKPDKQKTFRCLRFEEKYLKRIESSYKIVDKIEITGITGITLPRGTLQVYTDIMKVKITSNIAKILQNSDKNDGLESYDNVVKQGDTLPDSVIDVIGVTKPQTEREAR